ncbi:MAG: hypothetical protein ABW252_22070 [Polyangiales bacterium]
MHIRRSLWRLRPVPAAALALWSLHPSGSARAHQGGDPRDVESCYGRCGAERGTAGLRCSCDAACVANGDCCADRHEWCAPAAVAPVCGLVDETKRYSRICGTDLGFAFEHRGQLEIMFGDTWQYASPSATTCSDPGLLGVRGRVDDDAQASFVGGTAAPAWLPTSAATTRDGGATCPAALSFDRTAPSAPYTFTPLRLRDVDGEDLSLGLGDTPLTAFSDGTTAFALFGRGNLETRRLYVARRDPDERTLYHALVDLGHETNFHNPTAARVRASDDYAAPRGDEAGVLYLWGRPRFTSYEQQPVDTNGVYLARVALPFFDPASGASTFRAQHFAGLDAATGAPIWADDPRAGKPVFTRDFKLTLQIEVEYVASLGKWVMLYGGDVADGLDPPLVSDQPRHGAIHMRTAQHPWGPWSRPTPLLWREHVPWHYQCDAYNDTRPEGCDRKLPRAPHYPPGDWEPQNTAFRGASCLTTHPKPIVMPNLGFPFPLCMGMSQRGNLYAPNILTPWTRHQPRDPVTRMSTTTLYFVVSTWNPYRVVLAAADLTVPDYSYGDLRLQLRDAQSALVRASEGTLSTTHVTGGREQGATTFVVHGPADAQREPALGDHVALASVESGGYLAAERDAPRIASTRFPSAEWVLEPAGRDARVGASVAPGAAAFRLRLAYSSVDAPRFLASTAAGLRVVSTPTDEGIFRFGQGCARGDDCRPR